MGITAPQPIKISPRVGPRLAASALLGAIMSLCFAPNSLPLAPFIVLFLILILNGVTPREGAYFGLTFGLLFFGVSLRWLGSMFGAAEFTLWVLCALFPMLTCCLFAWLNRRLPALPVWLLFPVLWTGTEYFRSELMVPDFTWMGLGYSMVNRPFLVRPATLIGCYGVTFLICILGGVMANAWYRNHDSASGGKARIVTAISVIVWIALCAPGQTASPTSGLHIRLVQAASEQDDEYLRLSKVTTATKPDLIVWPEDSFVSDPHTTPKLWPKLAALPVETGAWFLFGARDDAANGEPNGFRKAAYLLNPHGDLVGKHFKNHLVHFFREGIAGREAHAIDTSIGTLGVGICFDMDYPDVARREVSEGAQILIAPSDNPAEWGPLQHIQHKQLFQMRAIECSRWIAVADTAGDTFVAAPTGAILSRVKTDGPEFLDATVPLQESRTLFVRGGWRFGQISLVALILLFVAGLRSGSSPKPTANQD